MCSRAWVGGQPLSAAHSRKLCHSERSVPKVLSSEIGFAIFRRDAQSRNLSSLFGAAPLV
jgi:hypothetical protein